MRNTYAIYWRDSRPNDLAEHLRDEVQLDRVVGNVSDSIADEAINAIHYMYEGD